MAEPASLAAGSVGTIETQYLDLPEPVRLDCGRDLHPIRVAYETYGALSPRRDNVILVCHALSGDAHAAGFAKTPPASSSACTLTPLSAAVVISLTLSLSPPKFLWGRLTIP